MDKRLHNQRQVKQYAKNYISHLQNAYNLKIDRAYLFGSYAKRTQRNWSDIDVCVISPKFNKTDPLSFLWKRRRGIDVDRGIEPYGLSPADFVEENPIAWEVKKHGVRIA